MTNETRTTRACSFRIEGTFDIPAARRLFDAMVSAPEDAEVRVDFSRVHDFRDNAVVLLSKALGQVGPRASVQGLREHHYRLLRYLAAPSVPLDPLPSVPLDPLH